MYLSNKEHTHLRTLTMDFEIPYRTYIADIILKKYPTESAFSSKVAEKETYAETLKKYSNYYSEYGRIKANPIQSFQLLKNTIKAMKTKVIAEEIEMPYVSLINVLLLTFSEEFNPFLKLFIDIDTFWKQATRYHYVRNKLSHPGCKTLEKEDLDMVVEFIQTTNSYLGLLSEQYFWLETTDKIEAKSNALLSENTVIPVEINNFADMPFPEMRLVCRDHEIELIKNYVYGKPGALRKKCSLCIFGYGGVGKTALVLETIKRIAQDIVDETTINGYHPKFILFYSAKQAKLDVSLTSGTIEQRRMSHQFSSCNELKNEIFKRLGIADFSGYTFPGLIIIDNLESLTEEERVKVKTFIEECSPATVQYIVTTRNEEQYEERMPLNGFKDLDVGQQFISEYIAENDLDISLSIDDQKKLLDISKGNTLVLILCIKRLEKGLDTISGLTYDLSQKPTVKKLGIEIGHVPANGYEIISEFMFKNTFEELEKVYASESVSIFSILKVLAVCPQKNIDIYTLSLLSEVPYSQLNAILAMLCRYMIVNKQADLYTLNEFAEKYIIVRFLPDETQFIAMSQKIESSSRKIQRELSELKKQIDNNLELKRVIQDWHIITDGDRIAAAKAFALYQDVSSECSKASFFARSCYDDTNQLFSKLEQTTMHPFVKYEKARILRLIKDSGFVIAENLNSEILSNYKDAIWIIKTNSIYEAIRSTKSYASILWLFGYQLLQIDPINNQVEAARYFEESKYSYERLGIRDEEYYQCLSHMGSNYLKMYETSRNVSYLRQARTISDILYKDKDKYQVKTTRDYSIKLRNNIKKYNPNI